MTQSLKILFLEGFYSGSHRYFLDMISRYSSHQITTVTLPEMGWRGNFNCSPLKLYQKLPDPEIYDLVVATSLVDIAPLRGFYRNFPPVIYYFHENQFAYPNQKYRYEALKNIHAVITSDLLIFNSQFHKAQFKETIQTYINEVIPDINPEKLLKKVDQSEIIYPGFDHTRINYNPPGKNKIPVILWNHRWSRDKNYELFFRWLRQLKKESIPFKFHFLGESLPGCPPPFDRLRDQFSGEWLTFGYLENRSDYYRALGESDIVISCAFEENFGISVMEGIASGATPLLPARLAYRELIPEELHSKILFKNDQDGYLKLKDYLLNHSFFDGVTLSSSYRGDRVVHQLDQLLTRHYQQSI